MKISRKNFQNGDKKVPKQTNSQPEDAIKLEGI